MLTSTTQADSDQDGANVPGAEISRGPMVSVVLVCRSEAEQIESVLESILQQEQSEGGMEILVADGMSDDGTREILQRIAKDEPRVRVIDNPARITSAGLNAAIRQARGQIIIRMDAHTHYAPDYIRQCVAALNRTGADNVGGPWVAQAKGYLGEAIAAAFQSRFAVGGARGHVPHYEGPVDTVYLGCWRREVFERVGNFDESLVRNQDDEHNLRIIRGGGRIWQSPRIRSWYHSRTSIKGLFDQYRQYGYWKVKVIRKHKLPASIRHLVPGSFLLGLILLILGWDSSRLALLFLQSGSALAAFFARVNHFSTLGLFAVLSTYGLATVVASVQAASRSRWVLFPVLPLIFCCYHVGYGWGFLRGVLDFAFFRRGASSVFTRLTRLNSREQKTPSGCNSSPESRSAV
jgi:succinoglycan biosynthesis protein ExoA